MLALYSAVITFKNATESLFIRNDLTKANAPCMQMAFGFIPSFAAFTVRSECPDAHYTPNRHGRLPRRCTHKKKISQSTAAFEFVVGFLRGCECRVSEHKTKSKIVFGTIFCKFHFNCDKLNNNKLFTNNIPNFSLMYSDDSHKCSGPLPSDSRGSCVAGLCSIIITCRVHPQCPDSRTILRWPLVEVDTQQPHLCGRPLRCIGSVG